MQKYKDLKKELSAKKATAMGKNNQLKSLMETSKAEANSRRIADVKQVNKLANEIITTTAEINDHIDGLSFVKIGAFITRS